MSFDVETQKLDGNMLDIYRMIVTSFLLTNKANWIKFFKKNSLIANISLKVVFEILFHTINNANIDYLERKLWWRTYIT